MQQLQTRTISVMVLSKRKVKAFLLFGKEQYFIEMHLTDEGSDRTPMELPATYEEFMLAVPGQQMDKTLYSTDGKIWRNTIEEALNS